MIRPGRKSSEQPIITCSSLSSRPSARARMPRQARHRRHAFELMRELVTKTLRKRNGAELMELDALADESAELKEGVLSICLLICVLACMLCMHAFFPPPSLDPSDTCSESRQDVEARVLVVCDEEMSVNTAQSNDHDYSLKHVHV